MIGQEHLFESATNCDGERPRLVVRVEELEVRYNEDGPESTVNVLYLSLVDGGTSIHFRMDSREQAGQIAGALMALAFPPVSPVEPEEPEETEDEED